MIDRRYMVKVCIDGEYAKSLGLPKSTNFYYARKIQYPKNENETDVEHELRLVNDVIFNKILDDYNRSSSNDQKYSSLELRQLLSNKMESPEIVEDCVR